VTFSAVDHETRLGPLSLRTQRGEGAAAGYVPLLPHWPAWMVMISLWHVSNGDPRQLTQYWHTWAFCDMRIAGGRWCN